MPSVPREVASSREIVSALGQIDGLWHSTAIGIALGDSLRY